MNRILHITLFLALAAYGQMERIAIMHTVDDGDSINVMDLGYLTDKLRDIGTQVLPKSRYGIMTQQSIVDRLGSQERAEKECREATCIADLGRKINADYITQGRIGRFSGKLTLKVELYKVSNSNLLASLTGDSDDLRGLLVLLESKAPKLFDAMPGVSSPEPLPPPPLPPQPPPPPPPPAPVPKKDCVNKFNINELVLKVEKEFPKLLKDCSATLSKNMALAASPFGKKTELKEPKAFMMECAIDGVKQKMPLGSESYVKPVESFLQNILDASSAGGSLDVKKLSGAIGGMDMSGLLGGIKKLAAEDDCVTDEPYEPSVVAESEDKGDSSEDKEDKRKVFSWGLRFGLNASHLYTEYENSYTNASGTYEPIIPPQLGLVFDWALNDWLHIQPGVMFIGKGAYVYIEKETTSWWGDDRTMGISGYIEIPLLLSLKLSAFRINAGPYIGLCVEANENFDGNDFGLSAGFGFDIGMFYIGTFFDLGLVDISNIRHFEMSNGTFGFNLGVNL